MKAPRAATLVALIPLALLAPAANATSALSPSVYGAGSGPLEPADRVHVVVTARGAGATAQGRFTIIHQTPTGLFAVLSGRVDCLAVNGAAAVATGTITSGFDGLGVDPVGHRVSIAVDATTVELDVSFVSEHAIAPCSSDPVLAIALDRGAFRVS
jgi:hypothetical protein